MSASPPLFLPPLLNARLWHLAFNQLPRINEQLVQGREGIFFGAEQNEQRKTRRLTLPVLAIGGEESSGAGVRNTMKLVAEDVQTVVLAGQRPLGR